MGVPLVRENLLLLLWVFPAIVVFFGALAIGCTFCCKRKPSWQKVPASWMTGCVFLQAPCIFIFASFWFVLIMFWADACQGFPNVAMQYVDGLQDDLCTEIANGALTPRARFVCVVLCVCVCCVCLFVADLCCVAVRLFRVRSMLTFSCGASAMRRRGQRDGVHAVAHGVGQLVQHDVQRSRSHRWSPWKLPWYVRHCV
jgi:hypothetical protein